MPYSLDWYIENEIIYASFSGVLTATDGRESLLGMIEMTESSPRPLVHIIADTGAVIQAASPKESMTVLREIKPHPRTGWTIMLHEKSILIKMGVMFGASLFKSRYRTFDSLVDARNFLTSMDPTLSWDRVNQTLVNADSP
jgi:hypothetical protein